MGSINPKLDANQVIRLAFDEATQSLRTSGSATAEQTVVQPDGSQLHVTVDESALPAGAATEAKQDEILTDLNNIQTSSSETASNTLATSTALSTLSNKTASAMVSVPFDDMVISYVGATSDILTVEYKNGGVTVATVTLNYDGQNRLTGVTRS